jgi:signal peptidase I
MNEEVRGEPEAKKSWLVGWWEWIRPIVIVLLVLSVLRSAVADWNDVPSGSMRPTILEGDRIFVNKLAYDLKVPFLGWRLVQWSSPQRGEVVVFFSPLDGTRMVKRVIAVPGDQVELRDNQLLINGEPATYEPLDAAIIDQIPPGERAGHRFAAERLGDQSHPVMAINDAESPRFFGPAVVPADHFFVMGDNRDNSFDSRFFGFVPRSAVVGRAEAVVFSLDRGDSYRPRWHRFFHGLD